MRGYLRQHAIRIPLSPKHNAWQSGPCDRAIDRLRERVEWLLNRLKQYRRLATRYEKWAENYRAMWFIAATL
jgi:transposase